MQKVSSITLLSFSGVGLPSGLLRLRGVLLHPAGEKPGDPAAHGLPAQPHHTQHDCGKQCSYFLIFIYHFLHILFRRKSSPETQFSCILPLTSMLLMESLAAFSNWHNYFRVSQWEIPNWSLLWPSTLDKSRVHVRSCQFGKLVHMLYQNLTCLRELAWIWLLSRRLQWLNILVKNMVLTLSFWDKVDCRVSWTLRWHDISSLETCFVFLLLEYLDTIDSHRMEFFPSLKLPNAYVD